APAAATSPGSSPAARATTPGRTSGTPCSWGRGRSDGAAVHRGGDRDRGRGRGGAGRRRARRVPRRTATAAVRRGVADHVADRPADPAGRLLGGGGRTGT